MEKRNFQFALLGIAVLWAASGCNNRQEAQKTTAPPPTDALSNAPPEVQQRMQRLQNEKARRATGNTNNAKP